MPTPESLPTIGQLQRETTALGRPLTAIVSDTTYKHGAPVEATFDPTTTPPKLTFHEPEPPSSPSGIIASTDAAPTARPSNN